MGSAPRESSPNPVAKRAQRLRERRRRGVVAVVHVEILATDVPLLARAGYLSHDRATIPPRHSLSVALNRLMDDWARAQRIKRRRESQFLRSRVAGVIPGG